MDKSTISCWVNRLSSSEEGEGNMSDLTPSGSCALQLCLHWWNVLIPLIHDDDTLKS